MAHVREAPSLRESMEIVTPTGTRYRWADDEYRPENIPSADRWSDTMPGGYETHDVTLPRKPGIDYSDLERLSTITRRSASGEKIWEGRLERAPRVSGDQVSISPSAVGWQAHLEDDKSVQTIYRDIDLSHWGPLPTDYRIVLIGVPYTNIQDGTVSQAPDSLGPALQLSMQFSGTDRPLAGAVYDAGGARIGSVYGEFETSANWTPPTSRNLTIDVSDDALGGGDITGDLEATSGTTTLTATTDTRKVARTIFHWNAVAAAGQGINDVYWRTLAVYGTHGLTNRGTEPDGGFYDADIIGHAISQWCPLLTTTTESLSASTFVIPQMAFLDPTTVGEIVRQSTRFGLRDWAVWDDKTFWLHDRGAHGRAWRARVGPAQLEETGPQIDRLWNSIMVAYQDVDGSTRTVGPVGSGADTEDDTLDDTDPDNPANQLGIIRRDILSMGTSTAAGATEIGRQFLEQSKLLDTSGRALIVGTVEDDRGVLQPYSHMHAGDTIVFTDASDTSARRIVRTEKNRSDRSCAIDLDSPPEGLQALLERLGVVLVPLGL